MPKMSEELIRKLTEPGMQKRIMADVDANGYALMVAVARYATFADRKTEISNDSLCDTLGYKAVSALHKIRAKCQSKEWLEYDNEASGKVGRYRLNLPDCSK